jgi:hypothetical protein
MSVLEGRNMNKKSKKQRPVYRVFANDEGQAFLRLEPANITVPIERPVTLKKLEQAKAEAINRRNTFEDVQQEQRQLTTDPRRAETEKEIEVALKPLLKGPWLGRAEYATSYFLRRISVFWGALVLIAILYKLVQYSSEHFPEAAHRFVLGLFLIGLTSALIVIGTEESRKKYRKIIIGLFGPYGMLVLPCLLLVTASVVLASITFRLYTRGLVALETCSGRPVTEAGLLDFFMWHFVNIVPTLQVTKLWRWGEPYCYTQSRIGLLIFVFQLLVVIPSFNTIRFYWKNRHTSGFVYDPAWNPNE